jgi:hypothetical protein
MTSRCLKILLFYKIMILFYSILVYVINGKLKQMNNKSPMRIIKMRSIESFPFLL